MVNRRHIKNMDKNTIIGFSLIGLILLGFWQLNKPSEKEVQAQKHYNNSIAVQQIKVQAETAINKTATVSKDSTIGTDTAAISSSFGDFSASANGQEKFYTLENELIKLTFSSKGGRIYSAQLKNYKTHDTLPLMLFDAKESSMGFTLVTKNNRVLNSKDLYFEPVSAVTKDASGNQTLIMRLKTTGTAYIDFAYTLPSNNYMLSFGIKANGMNTVMPASINSLDMQWSSKIRQQESSRKTENRYAAIEYKYVADNVEKLSESENEEKQLPNKVKWIAFKDQFFSSILIANQDITSATLKSKVEDETSKYLKAYEAEMTVAFDPTGKVPTTFQLFLGPNQYKILSSYDDKTDSKLSLNQIIPLGWGVFGWVNRYAIIPMFNLFSKFLSNFGLIILLMTIAIKLVLSPLTYKSYISSAKMRVLKPEIDEINARIPADKAAERQKATMDLYGKVGVSPLSGCLPSLLQMPILIALFNFFPASIELRQQSFLWAKDLSSYDAIFTWSTHIPLIGNHISLFCILMTITSVLYTHLNMASSGGQEQIPGMKWMMYLMPVAFMFMFNDYASGLSYYYFIATLFSVIQTYIIRATVDEEKLLAQLHAKRASNAKKPAKKGGFMDRLEKMQREQQKTTKGKK